MEHTMLAPGMTDGQIDDLANKLRDAARKHRDQVEKNSAQESLRSDTIGRRLFAEFQRIVKESSKVIVYVVSVNRTRSPTESLDGLGRRQYVNRDVAATMPRREGKKVTLLYFKPDQLVYKNGILSCADLAEEYRKRGLVPDPQAQIDDNAVHSEFSDTIPNACQWISEEGQYCCAVFFRSDGERYVGVDRNDFAWSDSWSFGGVPQVSLDT